MRQTLAVLALSALTAGCTVTTNGTVVAAPTLGHAPQPLPTRALRGLLLDSGAVGSIMGASLQVVDSADTMYTNRPLDDGCLIWGEAQESAYQGTGWTAVRVQELKDHHEQADHIAYQAVVALPAALGANNFYASQVAGWAHCDNRRVDLHDPTDPSAPPPWAQPYAELTKQFHANLAALDHAHDVRPPRHMSALIVFKVALVVFLAAGIGVLVVVGTHRSRATRADPRWRQPHQGQPGHLASVRGIVPKTPTPQTVTHNHHDTNPPPRHPPRPQGDVRPTTPE